MLTEDPYLNAKEGTEENKLKYLEIRWAYYDGLYFENKLTKPTIYFMRNKNPTGNQVHGVWYPTKERLGMNIRVFNASEEQLNELLLHEMCHQAVSQIDLVVDELHGPNWKGWMNKIGLTPNRLATKEENISLLTVEEKVVNEELINKKSSNAFYKKTKIPDRPAESGKFYRLKKRSRDE